MQAFAFSDSVNTGMGYYPSLVGFSRLALTVADSTAPDQIPGAIELYSGGSSVTVNSRSHNPLGSDIAGFGATVTTTFLPELIASSGIIQLENGNMNGQVADGTAYSLIGSQYRIAPNVYQLTTNTLTAGGHVWSIDTPTRTDGGPTVVEGFTLTSGPADTVGSFLVSLGQQTGAPQAYSLEFTSLGEVKLSGDAGTLGQVLLSNGIGNAVTWSSTVPSSSTASNLFGGVAGNISYQTAPSTSTWLATGTSNQVLVSGTTPSWTNTPVLTGTNFSGTAAALNIGGNAATATTAGTVTTAAQPAITSVGTLTSLSVSGNATVTGRVIRSTQIGISAAGATLGTATVLTKDINVVSSVTPGQGVALPTETAGETIVVINTSGNALNVYPSIGTAAIDSASVGTAFSLDAGARIMFMCVSATQWYTLNATYA